MAARDECPLYVDLCRLNALHARAGHVRPCLAERAARVDAARGVLDDDRLEPRLPRVERRPRDAEIGGQPDEEHPREPALLEIAGQPGLRLPIGLEKRRVGVDVLTI